jgi:hexokinase
LVELYPNFTNILRESLRKLVGDDVESRVQIGLAKDGSGVGGESFCFVSVTALTGFVNIAALGALVAVKHA